MLFILVCMMFVLLATQPVQTDMGVQPIFPGGSNIKLERKTPIQMAADKWL